MAWMHCRSCSAKFAVGLLRCPQCGAVSELFAAPEEVVEAEQEAQMPKISAAAGPSNALGETAESTVVDAEQEQAPAEVAAPTGQEPELAVESEPEDAGEATPEAAETKPEPAAPAAPKKRAAKKTAAPPAA